jgi:PmbA protein
MDMELATSERAQDAQRLQELAAEVLRLAAARGASQAEVSITEDTGMAVNVRMGEVETVERTRQFLTRILNPL